MTCECECGCGTAVEPDSRGRPRRFVHNHHHRGNQHTKGRRISPEHRAAISAANRGERHHAWKGDDAGYVALHLWVESRRPKDGCCRKCGVTGQTTHNANLSGEYRRDLDDFLEMCVPCHRAYDAEKE